MLEFGIPLDTVEYGYDDETWLDLLTSYDGNAITYDDMGNPDIYRNGDDVIDCYYMSYVGRQLVRIDFGDEEVTYEYDPEGQRTEKVVNGKKHEYLYYGSQLNAYTAGSGETLRFFYDDAGEPLGFYFLNLDTSFVDADLGAKYYYVRNAQGDMVQIRDSYYEVVANYHYDAWGKLLSITDALGNRITDEEHVAVLNPLRYRGYVYDTETGFYYVSSRYYDPEIGRWINADDSDVLGIEPGSLLHYNLFAYCWNNPVNMTDDNGYLPWFVAAAIGGALFDTAAYLIGSAISGQEITWAGVGKAALTGAVTGVAFGALGKGVKALTTASKATKVGVKIGTSFGKIGKLVKYRKIAANWSKTTSYAFRRMSERGMSKSMVEGILKNGKVLQQTANKFVYITQKGVVIVESSGKIVTAYTSKYFDSSMKNIVKQLFG